MRASNLALSGHDVDAVGQPLAPISGSLQRQCPLWVISRHGLAQSTCPLRAI